MNLACVHNVELDGGHEGDGRQPVEAGAQHAADKGNEPFEAVVQPRHVVGWTTNNDVKKVFEIALQHLIPCMPT